MIDEIATKRILGGTLVPSEAAQETKEGLRDERTGRLLKNVLRVSEVRGYEDHSGKEPPESEFQQGS